MAKSNTWLTSTFILLHNTFISTYLKIQSKTIFDEGRNYILGRKDIAMKVKITLQERVLYAYGLVPAAAAGNSNAANLGSADTANGLFVRVTKIWTMRARKLQLDLAVWADIPPDTVTL